jgi:hypothetical protein
MLPQRRKSGETSEEAEETDDAVDSPVADEPSAVSKKEQEEEAVATAAVPQVSEKEQEVEKRPLPARKVRSLRKSEQKPVELSQVETKNGIPVRRHDERELMEIRRIQATPPDKSIAYIQHLAAPWPWIVLAYLFPLAGAACGLFATFSPKIPEPDLQYQWLIDLSRAPWLDKAGFGALATSCAIGLAFAAWFALKKPRSRHHAGFIVILAVLIAVFGIIHQFNPNGP